jgi:hypothetical protein
MLYTEFSHLGQFTPGAVDTLRGTTQENVRLTVRAQAEKCIGAADPNVNALALTGSVDRAGGDRLQEVGFLCFVEKPSASGQLTQASRSVLDRD